MAFSVVSKKSSKTYFLHERKQELKGGQTVTLYYFAGEAGPCGRRSGRQPLQFEPFHLATRASPPGRQILFRP
jgi:hypothetical protein